LPQNDKQRISAIVRHEGERRDNLLTGQGQRSQVSRAVEPIRLSQELPSDEHYGMAILEIWRESISEKIESIDD